MTTQPQAHQLSELPQRIFEARLEALDAEQRCIAAENYHAERRNEHYLVAVAAGQGHYQAQATAASIAEVLQARQQRDRYAMEAKRAQARHQRLRDELTSRLQWGTLSTMGAPAGDE